MSKESLKQALANILALMYYASHHDFETMEHIDSLQDSLRVISQGLEGDEHFSRRTAYLCGRVRTSGVLSIPYSKPKGTEQIMKDCDELQRYLNNTL
jgi:hypothetical protein